MTGASPAIVEARFGHIDDGGRFAHNAAPIGRAELERAFRDGVDQLSAASPPGMLLLRQKMTGRIGIPGISAPERLREIAEVEPVASCRELKAGSAYSCPLLVERNDPQLAAIGASADTLLEGEFAFERDGADGRWVMADGFAESFAKAVAAARVKNSQQ